jgi:hypothetical protein
MCAEPKTPYRRLLNFHSKCAVVAAKDNGWVREENYVLNILDLLDVSLYSKRLSYKSLTILYTI